MDLYAAPAPSVAPTASFSAAGGDPNPATPGPSVAQTISAPVAGGGPNPAAMDLYIDSADNNGAPSLPIENAGHSTSASGVEGEVKYLRDLPITHHIFIRDIGCSR